MNQVDISAKKIESEWDKIEKDFGVTVQESEPEKVEGELLDSEAVEDKPRVLPQAEFDEKVGITKSLISSSMIAVFAMLKVGEIPEHITGDFSESWAVVIVKRFPDNPVTDFMEEYGDLIAAGSATLILIGAIRTSKSKAEITHQVKEKMTEGVVSNGN